MFRAHEHMLRTALTVASLILLSSCASTPPVSPAVRADLAPTGTLRVGINYGHFAVATKDPVSGELRGVAVDLIQEVGRRAGVPVQMIGWPAAAPVLDGLLNGTLDVGFIAQEASREGALGFTRSYFEVEGTYLVPPGSPIRSIADIDREGVRIGVSAKSAYESYLGRTLKHAKLVGAPGVPATAELLYSGKVDAMAGQKHRLVAAGQKLPGSRVLDGSFQTVRQALAIPKDRKAGVQYLRDFIEEAHASGFIARSREKHGSAAPD